MRDFDKEIAEAQAKVEELKRQRMITNAYYEIDQELLLDDAEGYVFTPKNKSNTRVVINGYSEDTLNFGYKCTVSYDCEITQFELLNAESQDFSDCELDDEDSDIQE